MITMPIPYFSDVSMISTLPLPSGWERSLTDQGDVYYIKFAEGMLATNCLNSRLLQPQRDVNSLVPSIGARARFVRGEISTGTYISSYIRRAKHYFFLQCLSTDLPPGWENVRDTKGNVYYMEYVELIQL